MNPQFVCVCGVSCSGKSSLLNALKKADYEEQLGFIEVGKEFRKRYPPEYFKGKAAMPDTEKEAWEIFDEQWQAQKDKLRIFIDGQPRMAAQISPLEKRGRFTTLWMHASEEELRKRIEKRDITPGDKELALQRQANDRIQLYDVLMELKARRIGIHVVNSEIDSGTLHKIYGFLGLSWRQGEMPFSEEKFFA